MKTDPKVIHHIADVLERELGLVSTPKPMITPKPVTKRDEPVKIPRMTRRSPPKPMRKLPRITIADPGSLSATPDDMFGTKRVKPLSLTSRAKTDARPIVESTPCHFCGGEVERAGAEWLGIWRFHRGCQYGGNARRVQIAAEALGLGSIDQGTALAVAMRVPAYHEVHTEPTYVEKDKRSPWGHVDKRELLSSLSDASTELAEATIPRACVLGRCAWCGVAEAVAWDESPYHWADGSDAPLCDSCGSVFVRRGSPPPKYMDDAGSAIAEAMTGVPGSLGVPGPAALLAYVEAEGQGTGAQPWDYLPAEAVEAFKWSEWASYGGRFAPVEHRAEALARAARPVTAEELPDPFGFRGERMNHE